MILLKIVNGEYIWRKKKRILNVFIIIIIFMAYGLPYQLDFYVVY